MQKRFMDEYVERLEIIVGRASLLAEGTQPIQQETRPLLCKEPHPTPQENLLPAAGS